MAKIIENPLGGRRMIRLTGDDVMMIVAMVQRQFRGQAADYNALQAILSQQPFYLPEEST